ncbi:DNA-binding protein [bacterium]|nr:DNA-binding protein [bacterium]
MKKNYSFTLILESTFDATEGIEDALYESGCSDGLVWTRNGFVFLDFTREAVSMEEAVSSAIQNIEGSRIGLSVGGIAPAPLVTQSMIAERLGVSREAVRLWSTGRRGRAAFPAPVTISGKGTAYWDWLSILRWRAAEGDSIPDEEIEKAETLSRISNKLISRRHAQVAG